MNTIKYLQKSILLGTTMISLSAIAHDLVNIRTINPKIRVELRYATDDNFTKQKVYNCSPDTCFVLREVAQKLDLIQKELEQQGLGFKVWDGLRTFAAQEAFWKILPDERYVSNPKKGGRHTRGTTIDLTLVDAQGNELEMPSAFDDFSEKAHADYQRCSDEAKKNRQILHDVMTKHGFTGLATEWWHFDLANWQEYEPIRFDFDELEEK